MEHEDRRTQLSYCAFILRMDIITDHSRNSEQDSCFGGQMAFHYLTLA